MRPVFCLLFLLLGGPAFAGAGDCGTIVVPPGLGVAPGADVTDLNPLFISSVYNQQAAVLIFEQLLWINRFHKVDWDRSIASAVTSPDQGKTYVITLRPWLWSDGVAVTSADVLFAFKLIKEFGDQYANYGLGGIPMLVDSMTAPDAAHVVVTLKRAVNEDWFILNGLSQIIPFPQHVWGGYSADQIWQGQSSPAFFRVTDGPLSLSALNVGIDAEFVPNPDYGGARMRFRHFIIKFVQNEAQELQAVQDHELDMGNIPFELFDKAAGLPGDHVVVMPPTYAWEELVPNLVNHATTYFADVRVREAMADAINQHEVIAVAMHGHGEATYSPVPPVPPQFLSPDAQAGRFAVGYDPAKAKALLGAAGFTPGADGVLQRGGQRLSFSVEIGAGQPLRTLMAEVIQRNFAAVGIEMKVRQVEFNQLLVQLEHQPQAWQVDLLGEDLSAYPTGEELFVEGGFLNDNGYSDPTMDRLVAQSTDAPGQAGLDAYQDYATAQQPVIFLPNPIYSVLVRRGLHGVKDFANPFGYWAPEKLYCTAP